MQELRLRHHPELTKNEVTVDILVVDSIDTETGESTPTLKYQGYPAAATIKATPLKQQALGQTDALMVIDTCRWANLNAFGQNALIDHELQHLALIYDDSGRPKLDDLRRPRLQMRLHDWQLGGFVDIANRHRADALEVRAVEACRDSSG